MEILKVQEFWSQISIWGDILNVHNLLQPQRCLLHDLSKLPLEKYKKRFISAVLSIARLCIMRPRNKELLPTPKEWITSIDMSVILEKITMLETPLRQLEKIQNLCLVTCCDSNALSSVSALKFTFCSLLPISQTSLLSETQQ